MRPAGSAIDVIEEQPQKAPLPKLVRLAGSSIDVSESQPQKAPSPRLVRPSGSSIDVIDVSPRNAPGGTHASPSRSAHAASSTSIGTSPSPRLCKVGQPARRVGRVGDEAAGCAAVREVELGHLDEVARERQADACAQPRA
ncbi:hypothetical protein Ctob_004098, partial [Chrysochromulina tobinii]